MDDGLGADRSWEQGSEELKFDISLAEQTDRVRVRTVLRRRDVCWEGGYRAGWDEISEAIEPTLLRGFMNMGLKVGYLLARNEVK